MALVDMKITKAEEKAEKDRYKDCVPCASDGGRYPYGLEVRLDTRALKKLDIEALPAVGKKFTLTASVVVESASSSQRREGEPDRNLTLQIQKLALNAGSALDALDEAGV